MKKEQRGVGYGPIVNEKTIKPGKYLVMGAGMIKAVRKVEIDGRPQVVIDMVMETPDGRREQTVPLTRQMAQDLTEALGPHPLVEEWLRQGEAPQ